MEEDTTTPPTQPQQQEDDEDDSSPAFIDMSSAVEVPLDANNDIEPMDDDDDEEEEVVQGAAKAETNTNEKEEQKQKDDSKATITTHTDSIYALSTSYNPTTSTLTIVSGGGDDKAYIHTLSPSSPTPSSTLLPHSHTDSISTIAFNNDYVDEKVKGSKRLIGVGSYDGSIVLYKEEDGEKVKVLEGPSDVECLCFHPKGGTVLLAGSIADGTLWMYHTPTSKCLQVFVGHESGITACSFTTDGKFAISASSDGTCRIWAPKTGLSRHVFRLMEDGGGLTCMAVGGGSDGQLVVVGGEDGVAYVCHVGTKKVVATLRHFDAISMTTAGTGGGGGMEIDGEEGEEQQQQQSSVEAVAFAPSNINPNWVATGGMDGLLKIWDLTNFGGTCRISCSPPPPPSTDESTTNDDNADEDTSPSSDKAGITRIQWHPSLPYIFTSCTDGIIRVWDARNGQLLQMLEGHGDVINDLNIQFVENKAIVVSGSDDKSVKVFEVDMNF